MPAELYDAIWEKVLKNMVQGMEMKWARVFMQLGDLLSGRFFEEYIKTGTLVSISSVCWVLSYIRCHFCYSLVLAVHARCFVCCCGSVCGWKEEEARVVRGEVREDLSVTRYFGSFHRISWFWQCTF